MRPPLSKTSFPVCRVGKKWLVERLGFILVFLISFFINSKVQGGKGKKTLFLKDEKKKFYP